jgi:dihydropteroate synthase
MTGKLYLRPAGILWGAAARDAQAGGLALRLAGGASAFTLAEVIEGEPGRAARSLVCARDLKASAEPAIRDLLKRIEAPRPAIAGIGMDRTRIMGIVNVTPDSFSDGGLFREADAAAAHARQLAAEGAEFVDIGGESTRPGALDVPLEEERRRVLPVLRGITGLGVAISIDTRKAAMMREAVAAGAHILNDVSALSHDPEALGAAAALACPVVLMHARGDPRTMQDNPVYADALLEVFDYLEARIAAAEQAGLRRERLIADPGIGFGKALDHNLALLGGLSLFHGLGVPVLLGASRKRIIGSITGKSDPKQRLPGSLAVALAAAAQGVQILRVHDVDETRQALDVWRAAGQGRGD